MFTKDSKKLKSGAFHPQESRQKESIFAIEEPNYTKAYLNAIEPLVVAEVERQLKRLPPHLLKYIHPEQVVAYALNRLPAMYATCEDGWHRQQQKAKSLRKEIYTVVRQGMAAVQQDPLRTVTALPPPEDPEKDRNAEVRERSHLV